MLLSWCFQPYFVRTMSLLNTEYNCQLLRHVQGFPLLRLLRADLTSKGSSFVSLLTRLPYHLPDGTPLDLSSSWCISSCMPRLDNSADSPQPHPFIYMNNGCFAWTSMALQTSSVSSNIYRSDTSTSGSRQSLWPTWFSVYASPILFVWCSPHYWKANANLKLRHRRNTRYRWLVKPYLTGTYTLQDASSFAWRTNASLRGKKQLVKISDAGAKTNCFLSFWMTCYNYITH